MKMLNLSIATALAAVAVSAMAQTTTHDQTPGTVNPTPATSPAEGTAADRTPPGETPVRGTNADAAPSERTAKMAAAGPAMSPQHRASRLIGRPVRSTSGKSLGVVRDVLIDDQGKVTAVVFAPGAEQSSESTKRTDEGAATAATSAQKDSEAVNSRTAQDTGSHGNAAPVQWNVTPSAAPWKSLQKLDSNGPLVIEESRVHAMETDAQKR